MSRSHLQTLETETAYALLSNATRLSVVTTLRAVERPTPEELARRLVRSDRSLAFDDSGSTAERTVTIALVHNHLPRLDAHDVVDYRGPDAPVTPDENFDELESLAEKVENSP